MQRRLENHKGINMKKYFTTSTEQIELIDEEKKLDMMIEICICI